MRAAHQIEPTSTDRILKCLGLAIDEARLVRSINESRDMADELKTKQRSPERLAYIDREIEYLDARLAEVRKKADREW